MHAITQGHMREEVHTVGEGVGGVGGAVGTVGCASAASNGHSYPRQRPATVIHIQGAKIQSKLLMSMLAEGLLRASEGIFV